MKTERDVHTEHCCAVHGCKYGDDDCTVVTGKKVQSFFCEQCIERSLCVQENMITKFNNVCIDWNEVSAIDYFRFKINIHLKGNTNPLTTSFCSEDDTKNGFNYLIETWTNFKKQQQTNSQSSRDNPFHTGATPYG